MPTPMAAVYLKRQIKMYSPLGRGDNGVKNENIPAVVATNDHYGQAIPPPPETMDLELRERLEKPFDLRSTQSLLHLDNRYKLTHPPSVDEWCHAVLQQCWYQCIGNNGGKLQMYAQDIWGYANNGLEFLGNNGCYLDPVNNMLHLLTLAILKDIKSAEDEDQDPLAVFQQNPGHRTAPIAIVPEILEFLPLSIEDRVHYHDLLSNLWSEVPRSKNVEPAWHPKRAIWRRLHSVDSSTPIRTLPMIQRLKFHIAYALQVVSDEVYEKMQSFMTREYDPAELEAIDAEWRGEIELQEQTSESDSFDSMEPEPRTPPNSPVGACASLAPNKFNWADDVIETSAQQDVVDIKTEENRATVVSFDKTLMQEILGSEDSEILINKVSVINGLDPEMQAIQEDDDDSVSDSDSEENSTAVTIVDIDKTLTEETIQSEANPTTRKLSAIDGFKPEMQSIHEENDNDNPPIHQERNDKIMNHFMAMTSDKYNIHIVKQFLLDPKKYSTDEEINVIVERVAEDILKGCR